MAGIVLARSSVLFYMGRVWIGRAGENTNLFLAHARDVGSLLYSRPSVAASPPPPPPPRPARCLLDHCTRARKLSRRRRQLTSEIHTSLQQTRLECAGTRVIPSRPGNSKRKHD